MAEKELRRAAAERPDQLRTQAEREPARADEPRSGGQPQHHRKEY